MEGGVEVGGGGGLISGFTCVQSLVEHHQFDLELRES